MKKRTPILTEAVLQFFLEQAMAIITVIAEDGTILYQSPSISRILGYDSRKRIGGNFITSKLVHAEDVEKKRAILEESIAHPATNFKTQLRLQHKDGSWRWAEVIFNNQLHNHLIGGIVIITHDITDIKRLELQKDDFIGFASHELKTPLTSIKGLTQILQRRFSIAHDRENLRLLRSMEVQEERLIGLVSDFLDVNKIQTGELSLRKHFFNLDDLIAKIIDSFQYIDKTHQIIKKGITKKEIFADEDRIEQVISNLLTNAIKYSPSMGTVIISVFQDDKSTIVSVQDFGFGIYKKDFHKIFERFYRTDEKEKRPISGFGLGLYIAKEIIMGHGGEIWVKSEKGKGSTFLFRLP